MIRSATLIETIIALLILMIAFSAGMMIFLRIVSSGVNDSKSSAGMEAEFLADSLANEHTYQSLQLAKGGNIFRVNYSTDQKHQGLIILSVSVSDSSEIQLAEHTRYILKDETAEN